ncbi:MAG: hypothetical protein H6832_03260 [Planctomycetes bacterium]|nr:hypothetical protein [Planctomycetota bacterium]
MTGMTTAEQRAESSLPLFSGSLLVGEVVRFDEQRRLHVTYPGLAESSVVALIATVAPEGDPQQLCGSRVLLAFPDLHDSGPIITGFIVDHLKEAPVLAESATAERTQHVEVDGRSVRLVGQEEVRLVCGRSSIVLQKDGKVVIRGDNLISRASGRNRIRGSAVTIN